MLPESVKVPEPLLTKLVAPLMAPVMLLEALEVLMVSVLTLEIVPAIEAAPEPEVMVRAELIAPEVIAIFLIVAFKPSLLA